MSGFEFVLFGVEQAFCPLTFGGERQHHHTFWGEVASLREEDLSLKDTPAAEFVLWEVGEISWMVLGEREHWVASLRE